MTADTAVLLMPAVVALACWLFSWRRTPFAVGWAAVGVALSALGVLWPEIVLSLRHHTFAGLLAAGLAGVVPQVLLTAVIEIAALDPPGAHPSNIAAWRQRHRRVGQAVQPRWQVETCHETDGAANVIVRVRDQHATRRFREIGRADPIADQGTYLALIAEARNVADELNALKVGE